LDPDSSDFSIEMIFLIPLVVVDVLEWKMQLKGGLYGISELHGTDARLLKFSSYKFVRSL